MPTCYVNAKTARLFEAASDESYEMIMIHGD